MSRICLRIYGRVQGVGFRYACCRQARALGVTGWVRNCCDGSVETVAEGSAAALAALSDWCRKGPPYAAVERVASAPAPASGEFGSFEIARDEYDYA